MSVAKFLGSSLLAVIALTVTARAEHAAPRRLSESLSRVAPPSRPPAPPAPTPLEVMAKAIFRHKCLDCHGGDGTPDRHKMFDPNGFPKVGHEPVTKHVIAAPVTDRIHMPPNRSPQLTPKELDVLNKWADSRTNASIPKTLTVAIEKGMFQKTNLVDPVALAKTLNDPLAVKPRIWNIGPEINIRGAVNIGRLSQPAALQRLDDAEKALPSKDVPIIIYCGCCVLEHCPNVLRALALLKERGYTQIKLLNLDSIHDWTGPTDPVPRPAPAPPARPVPS